MKLVTFGDSFVEGWIQKPSPNSTEERDRICFTRQLVERFDIFDSYENHGFQGNYNINIAKEAFNCRDVQDVFYIVVWSGVGRLPKGTGDLWKDLWMNTAQQKERIYSNGPKDQKSYYDLPPQFFVTEMLQRGLHQVLINRGIPHLFTSSFTPYTEYLTPDAVADLNVVGGKNTYNSLYDIIEGRFGTAYTGYREFPKTLTSTSLWSHLLAKDHGTMNSNITPCLHPSEPGHQLIADTLAPYIKKQLR